jgi:hypothetical protein
MGPWVIKTIGFDADSFLTVYETREDALIAVQNGLNWNYDIAIPSYFKNDGDRERALRAAIKDFKANRDDKALVGFHIRDVAKQTPQRYHALDEVKGFDVGDFTDYITSDDEEEASDKAKEIKRLQKKIETLEAEKKALESKPAPVKVEVLDLSESPVPAKRQRVHSVGY